MYYKNMSNKKTSPKQQNPQEEPSVPETDFINPENLEGVIIEEVEFTEITEITEVAFEDSEEDDEFDSLFPKKKKLTQEELEDEEDFDSYFFED